MTGNPYEPPLYRTTQVGRPRLVRNCVWASLWTAAVVVLVNAALYSPLCFMSPAPGSAAAYAGLGIMLAFYVFNLPGLPLFLALDFGNLIPNNDDDDLIRGLIAIACSTLSWSALAVLAAFIFTSIQPSRAIRTDETSVAKGDVGYHSPLPSALTHPHGSRR